MKLSLNWLKEYIDLDEFTPDQVSEMLTDLGLEVEGQEEVESIKGGLQGVVIGHVIECQQHPNADKLSLTKVDVGAGENLQIVCGAPNVATGQKVLVATTGTVMYGEDGSSFTIKKTKLRGETSEGMICAEDELGLGDSHDGIMVLPEDVPVGTQAATYFNVEKDVVFEIGLTPNRADGNSHIGSAKDLAAKLSYERNQKVPIKWPDVSAFSQDKVKPSPISVRIENTEACPRYAGLYISGVTIGPSPEWMQKRLKAIGIRPISNIVDITNFVLTELGQPLHAFDADKINGQQVIIKTLPTNTPFVTLDENERKLHQNDLMICDSTDGMCIAGVFGGIHSGVTETTKNIFLESAYFDPKYIRRTSFKHDLRTDAARCFEKGVDINRVILALKRAALLIKEYGGGDIQFDIVDEYPQPIAPAKVDLSYQQVRALIGTDISNEDINRVMEAMDFTLTEKSTDRVTVEITTDKPDVYRPADVIEEILRVYGYNQVPLPEKISSAPAYGSYPEPHYLQELIANYLADNGYLEAMGLSITQSNYFKDIFDVPEDELVYINNTSNMHLDVMRPMMLPVILEAIERSQNRQYQDVKYFEFGKTYRKKEDGFVERKHLILTQTGRISPQSWLPAGQEEADFYSLKASVEHINQKLGISQYKVGTPDSQVFAYGQKYHKGPMTLVEYGQVKGSILKKMSVKGKVFYAIFDWDNMLKVASAKVHYQELNKFPTIRRDLALVLDKSVKFGDIALLANKSLKQHLKEINLFDVYEQADQLGEGKKSYAISLIIQDKTKTLKDKEVEKMMNGLLKQLKSKFGAALR